MEITIRHVEPEDAAELHAILTSPHVVEGSMRLPYMPLSATKERIAPKPGTYQLAAWAGGDLVGFVELVTRPHNPRWAHNGEINLVAIRADRRQQGVARALMQHAIEFGERHLGLRRIGLYVWSDNEHAIGLYQSLGFEREGCLRQYARSPDGFYDAVVMGKTS